MKFIEEGLKNGGIMPDVPFELVYGGGLRGLGIAYLRDFSKYSQEARQEVIKLIVSVNREDICRAYLEDIYYAMYAWGGSLMLFDVRNLATESRKILIKEMLLWKEWGVSGIDNVLYRVAFGLLYYGRCELFTFAVEKFEDYPEDWREKIVKGLLAIGQEREIERFACASLRDLNCPDRYDGVQKELRQKRLFTEFGRWQSWGLDLFFMEQELERVLFPFIADEDTDGFASFFTETGIKLNQSLSKSLIQRVCQPEALNRSTFLDIINKNRK